MPITRTTISQVGIRKNILIDNGKSEKSSWPPPICFPIQKAARSTAITKSDNPIMINLTIKSKFDNPTRTCNTNSMVNRKTPLISSLMDTQTRLSKNFKNLMMILTIMTMMIITSPMASLLAPLNQMSMASKINRTLILMIISDINSWSTSQISYIDPRSFQDLIKSWSYLDLLVSM